VYLNEDLKKVIEKYDLEVERLLKEMRDKGVDKNKKNKALADQ